MYLYSYEACFKGEIVFYRGTVAKSSLKQEDFVQSTKNNFTYLPDPTIFDVFLRIPMGFPSQYCHHYLP